MNNNELKQKLSEGASLNPEEQQFLLRSLQESVDDIRENKPQEYMQIMQDIIELLDESSRELRAATKELDS